MTTPHLSPVIFHFCKQTATLWVYKNIFFLSPFETKAFASKIAHHVVLDHPRMGISSPRIARVSVVD
jgi:hypothetical protein